MANYNSSNTNRRLKASSDKVRIMSEVIDFTATTTANSGDTFDAIALIDKEASFCMQRKIFKSILSITTHFPH